jgi:hypothetical protein
MDHGRRLKDGAKGVIGEMRLSHGTQEELPDLQE